MSNTMKAALLYGARDIRVEPLHRPELQAGMVLLRNRRVGICGFDLHDYEQGHCGTSMPDRPFVLGHEFTAEVAADKTRR
jgi:threonine dehydrogenase-like Zn-dependent dehydrogenase